MTESPDDQPLIPHLDKNVSSNWRPVAGLKKHPGRMMFSDRLWYWFLSLGGLAMTAAGIWVCSFGFKKGLYLVVGGIAIFAIGPTQAARNGYRIHQGERRHHV
jgi:hypothetical protein